MPLMRVTVVGGGSWGTTIAQIASTNGHRVLLLLRDPKVENNINSLHENTRYLPGYSLHPSLRATRDWEEALANPELVVVAVPSSAMERVVSRMKRYLLRGTPVVSATKGLAPPGLRTMTDVLEEYLSSPVGALGGPNLSQEILQGQPAASVIASHFGEVIEAVHELLSGPMYRVYASNDPLGVQLGGALKNIYAIGSGIAEALGYGLNAKAFFLTRALAEMERLGKHLGADPMSFRGLAGMGDLIATANSTYSRNFRLGMMVGDGVPMKEAIRMLGQVAEGAATVAVVHEYLTSHEVDMPQAEGIYRILYEGLEV